MTDIVRHLEDRYGADEVRSWYFEIWNEPSWMYSLGDTEYPTLYRATSKGLIAGDSQIRVGGPAGSSGESPGAIASILQLGGLYQTRVDFISYHRYADDSGGAVADANGMLAFHRQMASLVSSWHFAGQLLNDEFGPSWTPDVSRDTEVAASFIAKTIHLIGSDTVAPPPTTYGYWAVSDLYEEINTGSALAYREGNFGLMLKGDPKIPASYDVPKPSFNAFRLLHMMSDTSLAVAGGTSDDGVNAAATMSSDQSAVQVLVYHHVTGGAADSSQSSVVALNVDHLPFADGPVRVRQYLVDAAHANSHTAWVAMQKPAQPTADQWATLRSASDLCYYESSATVAGGSLSLTFPQSIYGIRLVELRP
jgi:xylan 1,4-beta-xylosidase